MILVYGLNSPQNSMSYSGGESAIYTYQNSKLIQQKCDIEYYP